MVKNVDTTTRRFGRSKRLDHIRDYIIHPRPSFPSSSLGMPIGGRGLREGFFNLNIFKYFEILHPIKHILSFGSAKPTKAICRVGLLAHQKDRV